MNSSLEQRAVQTASNNSGDDLIDLGAIAARLWRAKLLIVGVVALCGVASAAIMLYQPNVYRAEALLSPAAQNDVTALGALASQFGGLASLAGIDVGAKENDKTVLAIEVLKSREFIVEFIRKHDLLVPLFAAKRWDRVNDTWRLDESIYNPVTKQWVRDVAPPKQPQPSDWEAYSAFREILSISQDKKTRLIRLSVDSLSPQASKQWVDWLIEDVNKHIRAQDVAEAQRAIEYLQKQITQTSIAGMQAVFYQLIEQQTKTILLAEVREEYAFKVIDPAVVPEEKAKPKRSLIVIASAVGGLLIGMTLALMLPRYAAPALSRED